MRAANRPGGSEDTSRPGRDRRRPAQAGHGVVLPGVARRAAARRSHPSTVTGTVRTMQPPAIRFNVRIPLRGGITLSADLTFPTELPAPAVVIRTPYGKSGEMQGKRAKMLAAGGYVAVLVDVRGRGDSDGTFQPYRNDGPDGADVIEWAAAQDWCTGGVATYGGSYGGRIQFLAALQQPPSLKAMVAMVTPSDPFVETPTGVPGLMHANWYRLVSGRTLQFRDDLDWMEVYRHRPIATMDEAAGFVSASWREECRHPTLDEWWEPVRYQHRIDEIDVPTLHISGWYDDEEIGTPLNFAAMVAAGRDGQRLLMGPWGHAVNTTRTLGDIDFGPSALIDLDAAVLAFLDEHLRGESQGPFAAPVRMFVMGVNEWRDADAWPPPDVTPLELYLSSGGRANSLHGDGRLQADPAAPDEAGDPLAHD